MTSTLVNIHVVCSLWMLTLRMCTCDFKFKEPELKYFKGNGLPTEIIEKLSSVGSGDQRKDPCIVITRDVRFTRYCTKNGFHRDIHSLVTVVLDPAQQCSTCELLLIENLPSGLFVDRYQAAGAVEFGGPKIVAFEDTDLEKPAYLSKAHTLLVYPSSQSHIHVSHQDDNVNFTVKMPIHLRYNRPSADPEARSARVSLPAPYLLLKCKAGRIIETREESGEKNQPSLYKAPCNGTSKTECLWQLLPQTNRESKELYFDVPVGQQNHMFVVTTVTILATVVGTVALLITMTRTSTKYKPD